MGNGEPPWVLWEDKQTGFGDGLCKRWRHLGSGQIWEKVISGKRVHGVWKSTLYLSWEKLWTRKWSCWGSHWFLSAPVISLNVGNLAAQVMETGTVFSWQSDDKERGNVKKKKATVHYPKCYGMVYNFPIHCGVPKETWSTRELGAWPWCHCFG